MPFSLNDIHSVGEILAFAARTEIMPRFRQLTPAQVCRKSSTFDLVTEADEAAEVAITAALKLPFPDSVVIGEESTHREPELLQTIADAELAFIVDPIDGTKNFASNLPLFGVMAAVTLHLRERLKPSPGIPGHELRRRLPRRASRGTTHGHLIGRRQVKILFSLAVSSVTRKVVTQDR
jgi:3'-phosphoadenosine 5'-phosphosulfate (PAPS) 3'-phosphatase